MSSSLSRSARVLASRRTLREQGRATMADVAREAGVSSMTVSRVINGGCASAAARSAVLKAIEALDYRPDVVAQRLAAARTPARVPSRPVEVPNLWAPYGRMLSQIFDLAS